MAADIITIALLAQFMQSYKQHDIAVLGYERKWQKWTTGEGGGGGDKSKISYAGFMECANEAAPVLGPPGSATVTSSWRADICGSPHLARVMFSLVHCKDIAIKGIISTRMTLWQNMHFVWILCEFF